MMFAHQPLTVKLWNWWLKTTNNQSIAAFKVSHLGTDSGADTGFGPEGGHFFYNKYIN